MNKKSKKNGVTLVELIIVLAIGMVILGVIYEIYSSQYKMYQKSVAYDKAQVNGTNCIAYFRESIINADIVEILSRTGTSLVPVSVLTNCKDIVKITPHSDPTKPYVYTISNNKLYKYYIVQNSLSPVIATDIDDNDSKTYVKANGGVSYIIQVKITTVTDPFTTIASRIWG